MPIDICRHAKCRKPVRIGYMTCWWHSPVWQGLYGALLVVAVIVFGTAAVLGVLACMGLIGGCVAVPRGAAVGIDVDGVDRVLQYIDQRIPATPTGQGDLIGLFLSGAVLYGGNQVRKWLKRRNGKIGKRHARKTAERFNGPSE